MIATFENILPSVMAEGKRQRCQPDLLLDTVCFWYTPSAGTRPGLVRVGVARLAGESLAYEMLHWMPWDEMVQDIVQSLAKLPILATKGALVGQVEFLGPKDNPKSRQLALV